MEGKGKCSERRGEGPFYFLPLPRKQGVHQRRGEKSRSSHFVLTRRRCERELSYSWQPPSPKKGIRKFSPGRNPGRRLCSCAHSPTGGGGDGAGGWGHHCKLGVRTRSHPNPLLEQASFVLGQRDLKGCGRTGPPLGGPVVGAGCVGAGLPGRCSDPRRRGWSGPPADSCAYIGGK